MEDGGANCHNNEEQVTAGARLKEKRISILLSKAMYYVLMEAERTPFSHRLFEVGIFVKFLHAILQFLVAPALFLIKPTSIQNLITSVTAPERREDPQDILVNFLLDNTHHLSPATIHFAALYLFVSAVVNLVLVYGLYKQKLRAYPFAIATLFFFVIYQLQSFAQSHSPWMLVLSAYDLTLAYLIFREFTRLRVTGILK